MDPITIRVMVFGEQGAGKTLYLAGLFRQMSVSRPGAIVTLHASELERLRLNQIYADLVNPRLNRFPPSTHWDAETWRFECQLTNRHGVFRPMVVEYVDYEGRMLNPLNAELDMTSDDIAADEGLRKLSQFRDSADAFLLLIDGHLVLRMLQGEQHLDGWLDNYLSQQLQVMERRLERTGGRPPLHVVITKWDLLDGRVVDGERVTLSSIGALLARQPIFADHLESRVYDGDGQVRLIPVSVTGPFAALDEQTGQMVKVPDQPVVPYNLEVPFVALLPDTLQWTLEQMATGLGPTKDDPTVRRLHRNADLIARARGLTAVAGAPLAAWLARRVAARRGGSSSLLSSATAELAQGLLGHVDALLDGRAQVARDRLRALEEGQRQRQRAVATERDAFTLTLQSFAARLETFAIQHPGSVLTTGVSA